MVLTQCLSARDCVSVIRLLRISVPRLPPVPVSLALSWAWLSGLAAVVTWPLRLTSRGLTVSTCLCSDLRAVIVLLCLVKARDRPVLIPVPRLPSMLSRFRSSWATMLDPETRLRSPLLTDVACRCLRCTVLDPLCVKTLIRSL